jgi:hypothetical protein
MQVETTDLLFSKTLHKEGWFEQRRDFFMRQVFEDFFSIFRSFQDLYQVYLCSKIPGSR